MTPRRSLLRFDPTELTPNDFDTLADSKVIDIIDRVGEFCDKGISRDAAMMTLLAQHEWISLYDTARYLNRHTTQNSYMPEIIVSTIYDAREVGDRNSFIPHGSYDLERDLPF